VTTLPASNSGAWRGVSAPIYPTAAQWADSVANVAVTIGSLSLNQPNSHARLIISVPSGTTQLVAWIGNTLISGVFSFDGSVGVYVDGVYNTSWANPSTLAASVVQPFYLTLDGSAHTVELWAGYQQLGSTPLTFLGTQVYAVQGAGISLVTPPSAIRRTVFYGDSICEGGASSPNQRDCYLARLRGIAPAGMAISQEGAGARALWDDSGTGSGQQGFASQALLASRLVALVAGATTREVVMVIGYNDINGHRWANDGAFAAAWGTALDAIHSADSGVHIYGVSMIDAAIDFASVRTLMAAEAATRTGFCTYVDGTTLMASSGLSGDGTHPTSNGHQALALGTGPDAGTSSFKAMLGI